MWTIPEFGISLFVILAGAALFTNAVEILGGRLGMREEYVRRLTSPAEVEDIL